MPPSLVPPPRRLAAGGRLQRLDRVFAYIDQHLADDLSLDRLAALAAFSRFHFHRVFRAWTGETVHDFVRRRRLESAGALLSGEPQASIATVAHRVGFDSPASFTRAFRAHYGMTPTAWRFGDRPPRPAAGLTAPPAGAR